MPLVTVPPSYQGHVPNHRGEVPLVPLVTVPPSYQGHVPNHRGEVPLVPLVTVPPSYPGHVPNHPVVSRRWNVPAKHSGVLIGGHSPVVHA